MNAAAEEFFCQTLPAGIGVREELSNEGGPGSFTRGSRVNGNDGGRDVPVSVDADQGCVGDWAPGDALKEDADTASGAVSRMIGAACMGPQVQVGEFAEVPSLYRPDLDGG